MRLILFLCLLMPVIAWADRFIQVPLKHRSAQDIQHQLQGLTNNQVSIVSDNQALLIRGSAADVESLAALIRQLDKPVRQLHVWVYRGADPTTVGSKFSTRQYSTQRGQHDLIDRALIAEGTPLVVTETELILLPTNGSKSQRDSTDQGPRLDSDDRNNDHYEVHRVETGIHIVPSLLERQQVSLLMKVVNKKKSPSSNQHYSPIITTIGQESTVVIGINQWTEVSRQQQNAIGPSTHNIRIHSTKTSKDQANSIWIKVNTAQ